MVKDKKLYIPYGLIIEPQWWDGCGPKQKPQLIIGAVISLAMAIILSLLFHIIIGIGVGILGLFATVMLITKQEKDNLSIVDYIQLIKRKKNEQQKFEYKYNDDYGLV